MSFSPIQFLDTGILTAPVGGATPGFLMPAPVTAGNGLLLFSGAGLAGGLSAVTDSQGNTWTQVAACGDVGTCGAQVQIWFCASAAGGPLTVFPTISNGDPMGSIAFVVCIMETPAGLTFDAASNTALAVQPGAASAGTSNTTSVTTTDASDVVFVMWFDNAMWTGSTNGGSAPTASAPATIYTIGNLDYPGPGKGGYLVGIAEPGAAGVFTNNIDYEDLNGQPFGFGEAPELGNQWGTAQVLAAFKQSGGGGTTELDECGVSHDVPSDTSVVTDICERAGLESWQIDTSLLTPDNLGSPTANIVMGYAVPRPTPARDILKVLMEAYFFTARETGGAMQFVPLGLASVESIPEADLGLKGDGAKIVPEQIAQESDLPLSCTVTHDDPTLDFQQNKQIKRRNTRIVSTRQQKILEIPMTMIADWAMQVATKALYLAWVERFSYKLNLWRAIYALLDPGDVIQFTYESLTFQIRILDMDIGAGLAISISGVSEYAQVLNSNATGGQGLGMPPNPLQLLPNSLLWIFDMPLLRDIDSNAPNSGFYFAMSSSLANWNGGVLEDSTDDSNFGVMSTTSNPATFGLTTNTLGSPRSPWTWDRVNTVTVQLQRGTFASDTALNVLNGTNQVIVGDELIQYRTAVQNMDGTWTLSNLLRGRRGTEWAIATHVTGELVLVPASGIVRVPQPLSIVGQQRWYKGVTIGQDPSTADSVEETLVGRDLMPYAPVHIKGTRDMSGNLTINWVRRTRIGWLNLAQDPVPLAEDSEQYEIDVYNGSTLVRSVTGLTSPTASYSAADQTTDFGSPQASVSLKAYQISGEVGKGFAGIASV